MTQIINENWDLFLKEYYHQDCVGCKNGHNSFWKTIIESEEWKKWKENNHDWDFAENEELGILSDEHFNSFVEFIKKMVDKTPKKCDN